MLQRNGEDLLEWIDTLDKDNNGLLILAQGGLFEAGDVQGEYLDELFRRWHNYIASAMTMVDHVRILMRKESSEFQTEYNRVRQERLSSPVVPFTQGLRNYVLHKGWPPSFMRMSFGPGATPLLFSVGCRAQELLKGWDWKSRERVYLEQAGSEFLLRSCVIEYMEVLDDFYDWFWNALTDQHTEELQELEALNDAYDAIIPPEQPLIRQFTGESRPEPDLGSPTKQRRPPKGKGPTRHQPKTKGKRKRRRQ